MTPRNTPTVINAVFNVRNLWDGRASDIFTGLTPFGDSDPRANVVAVRDALNCAGTDPHRQLKPRVAGGRTSDE